MILKVVDTIFSVCKVEDYSKVNLYSQFCFIGKTDEENFGFTYEELDRYIRTGLIENQDIKKSEERWELEEKF